MTKEQIAETIFECGLAPHSEITKEWIIEKIAQAIASHEAEKTVIHCKALRSKESGNWLKYSSSWRVWMDSKNPIVLYDNLILNIPSDAELVNLTILEEGENG